MSTNDPAHPALDTAFMVRHAVAAHSMNSARTAQSTARLLGPSEVGGCRAYLARVVADVPFDDMSHDVKWAAFIGTAVGARLEQAMAEEYPDEIRTQVPVQTTFPSGLTIAGNVDVVRNGIGVMDFKSVDGVETVRRTGPSFQQLAQVNTYLLGLIQAGQLPPEATWSLVYVDRSGAEDTPVVFEGPLDTDVIDQIDMRLADVIYAVEHDLNSAPRDQPYDWCVKVCLTGDTEVVTRQGIRRIADLAGGTADLLIPSRQVNGLTWHGSWSNEKVLSFGMSPVRTITLGRGKSRKTVRATPDHQWILRESGTHNRTQQVVRTDDLQPGDVMRSIRRNRGSSKPVRVAQMQGYVFGDGHLTAGGTTAVNIYENGGDNVEHILPLFAGHRVTSRTRDGAVQHTVHGLPSLWKLAPDFRESTAFLLSWLSGYVAADGTISAAGITQVHSSNREHVDLVRSVAAICGIGYGPVTTTMRLGKGAEPTALYAVTLRTEDLPDWFFIRPFHADRAHNEDRRNTHRDWRVISVEDHGEIEEVFCAVVDDVESFALSDGLLTHNCPMFSKCRGADEHLVTGLIESEEHLRAVKLYGEGQAMAKTGKALMEESKKTLAGVSGSTGEVQVSWTHVNATTIAQFVRAPYDRLTIAPVRRTTGKARTRKASS